MSMDGALRGEHVAALRAAMERVPELAGRTLHLTPLSGGITNRNFLVEVDGAVERYVIRLAGNDTHLLGISREVEHAATVAAAGLGIGAEVVAFLRPEGYLVTRFIEGTPLADVGLAGTDRIERTATALRRFHDGPAIPGLFVPFRLVEAYRALAVSNGVPIPIEYGLAHAVERRIELALLATPIELRPCHNDLLSGNLIDDGRRIRIVDWEYAGMGDPFFDLGNLSVNNGLDETANARLLAAYAGGEPRPDQHARLVLMQVVSDFREAMWGVLQQGISELHVDFRAYAGEHFERLLANAATPRFEHALREVTEA
jgi:thiamine kinase-like enzyme